MQVACGASIHKAPSEDELGLLLNRLMNRPG